MLKVLYAGKIKSKNFELKLPVNIESDDIKLFEKDCKKEYKAVDVFELHNINLTPDGVIFKGVKVFQQFLIWPSHKQYYNFFYLVKNYIKRRKVKFKNDYVPVVCFDYWSSGYFHWICDFLPRIITLQHDLNNLVVLLPENLNSVYVESSLKAIGVKHIHKFSVNTYLNCTKLIIPGYITPSGDTNPDIMLQLQQILLAYFKPGFATHNSQNFTNIYISRARTKGRKVLNEQAVIECLKRYDFKIIYFEDYTFEEQIFICYSAKNIIGIHGANLTNILFMQPGSNVLELRRFDDNVNNYYYTLATGIDLNYYYQKCATSNVRNEQTFDITVNIKQLENTVKNMLASFPQK